MGPSVPKNKNYYLETDLIEISGKEALEKLGEKGNIIYLDFEKVEKRADDSNNQKSPQYQEALDYIHSGTINQEDECIYLPAGGVLKWNYSSLPDDKKKKIHHITRLKGLQSFLKRKKIVCEYPRFLRFLTETFDYLFLDLEFDGQNVFGITIEQIEEKYPEHPFFHNQIIRFNKSDNLIYRIEKSLIQAQRDRWKFSDDNVKLVKIKPLKIEEGKVGFKPRNKEQEIAYQMIKDRNIEMVIMAGGSGSGKTVVSYAAAIEMILDADSKGSKREAYDGIVLFKPGDIIGGNHREEGYLPGTAYEKAKPYLQSFEDAHRILGFDNLSKGGISFSQMLADPYNDKDEFGKRISSKFLNKFLPPNKKAIEAAHLRYCRGRTFENQIILVDEAQNFSPFEIKQLVERVGQNSKIIIVGDPEQIDNPNLDKEFNGLVYCANIFFNKHPRLSIIKLNDNFRSQSAEIMREKRAPRI